MEFLRRISEKQAKKKKIRREKEIVFQEILFALNPEFPHKKDCARNRGFKVSYGAISLSGDPIPFDKPKGECRDCGTYTEINTSERR